MIPLIRDLGEEDVDILREGIAAEGINDATDGGFFQLFEKMFPFIDIFIEDGKLSSNEFLFILQAMVVLGMEDTIRNRGLIVLYIDREIAKRSRPDHPKPSKEVITEARALLGGFAASVIQASPTQAVSPSLKEEEEEKKKRLKIAKNS